MSTKSATDIPATATHCHKATRLYYKRGGKAHEGWALRWVFGKRADSRQRWAPSHYRDSELHNGLNFAGLTKRAERAKPAALDTPAINCYNPKDPRLGDLVIRHTDKGVQAKNIGKIIRHIGNTFYVGWAGGGETQFPTNCGAFFTCYRTYIAQQEAELAKAKEIEAQLLAC